MFINGHLSAPTKLVIRFVLTIALVCALNEWLYTLFLVVGGLPAYIIIGALLTLMNVLIRPLLNLAFFPLKLFATLIALIGANGIFLWLTEKIAAELDPNVVVLQVTSSTMGWLLLAIILGVANWVIKSILR